MPGVAARCIARESGATLRRTESLNASPAFIRLLAALVGDAIAGRPALSDPLRSTGAPPHGCHRTDRAGDPAGTGRTESKGSVPAEPSAAQHRTWTQNFSM